MGNFLSVPPRRPLLIIAALDFGIQWALWSVAAFYKTEKFFDLAGSSTFLFLTLLTLRWYPASRGPSIFLDKSGRGRNLCQPPRLSLICRSSKEMDESVQFQLAKPVFFICAHDQSPRVIDEAAGRGSFLFPTYLGRSKGLCSQGTADHQKSWFRDDPANKGKWISTGLWSLCRHPNYLGEILLWSSLFLPASSVMSGHQYWSVISPMSVAYFLTRLSGIPLLERQGLKKWGHLGEYHKYRQNTAKLIPYLW
ncbi:uncharacterized protein [Montipora foliosa]|uniref:uncharacterized protein n=1 Tax=Montipora foliosa TaxID=591990 RepID=UPI0035F1ACDD